MTVALYVNVGMQQCGSRGVSRFGAPLGRVASYWSPLTVRLNTKRYRLQAWCSSLEWTDPRENLHTSGRRSHVMPVASKCVVFPIW